MSSEVGRYAVCLHGIVGRCQSVERDAQARRLYVGVTLDGKPWQTLHPRWIRDVDVAQIRTALQQGTVLVGAAR